MKIKHDILHQYTYMVNYREVQLLLVTSDISQLQAYLDTIS